MSRERAHQAWRHAEAVKRLSDRLIGVGPIGIGLDGVIAWIPGANAAYSLGAGGLLMAHAVRSQASGGTIARMAAYLVADTLSSGAPVIGWAVDTLFPGHLMAAKALQKDIEARHGKPADAAAMKRWPFTRRGKSPPAAHSPTGG